MFIDGKFLGKFYRDFRGNDENGFDKYNKQSRDILPYRDGYNFDKYGNYDGEKGVQYSPRWI
jgi:hypothetical protein